MFAHPWVYVVVLLAMGIASDALPTFCRRPLVAYEAVAVSTVAIGFEVWAPHVRDRHRAARARVLPRGEHADLDPERGRDVRMALDDLDRPPGVPHTVPVFRGLRTDVRDRRCVRRDDGRRTAPARRPAGAGACVYAGFCARCHSADGAGVRDHGPALAGNSVVLAADPTSAIRIVVEGARPAPGTHGPVQRMPAMRGALTSSEIAAVVSYVRGAWENRAAPVSEQDVRRLRAAIHH